MFCIKCGNKIQPGVKFCKNCGNKIENNTLNSSDNKVNYTISETIPSLGIISYLMLGLSIFLNITNIKNIFRIFDTNNFNAIFNSFTFNLFAIPIIYIIGLIIMIITKVMYNKNRYANILLISYIIFGIILAIEIFAIISIGGSCLSVFER